jgi:hypothetical protein
MEDDAATGPWADRVLCAFDMLDSLDRHGAAVQNSRSGVKGRRP